MKLRKIIALFATLSISMSVCASVSAAVTTTEPEVAAVATKLTNDEFVGFYDEDIPEGKEAWTVSFEIANITDSLNYTKTAGTNAKPKLSGAALDNMEIILSTADTAAFEAIDRDYSYVVDHALNATLGEGFTSDGYSFNYAGNFVYPAAKDTEGIVDGSTEGFMTMCFLINAGDVVNFSVSNATISIIEYTDSSISGQTDFSTDKGNLSVPKVITIGAKDEPIVPEEPVAQSVPTAVFEPAVGDYVEVTLSDDNGQKGDAVKFSLPDNVKGQAKVLGFLKYTIGEAGDGREAPAAGDTLTAVLKSISDTAKAVTILTEKVK